MDPFVNFGFGIVKTPPSPADSGTTLELYPGHGITIDPSVDGEYNVVIVPNNVKPLSANSEIVRITAKSADTFTIDRAEESTNARTIQEGDFVFLDVTAKTLTDIRNMLTARLAATIFNAEHDATTGAHKTDTIAEKTSGNGVSVDGLKVKDGTLVKFNGWQLLDTANQPTRFDDNTMTNPAGIDWTDYLAKGDSIEWIQNSTTKKAYVYSVTSTAIVLAGDTVTASQAISGFRYSKIPGAAGRFNFTTTVSSLVGTISSGTLNLAKFWIYGDIIFFDFSYTVNTAGTGANLLIFTVPAHIVFSSLLGYGRVDGTTGHMLQAVKNGVNNSVAIGKYDNTTAIGSGAIIQVRCQAFI